MTNPERSALGRRLRDAIEKPFGERWRHARIEASVFFTFTFHRQHFEEHLLPELYGLPTDGERSARLALLQCQFDAEHRPVVFHDAHLPVERAANGELVSASALANPASFRIETVPVRWGDGDRTCMHAKHVCLLVRDADPERPNEGRDALIVLTASANLTLAGWRKNIEIADLQVFGRGQSTPMAAGLQELCADAWSWAERVRQGRQTGALSGLRQVEVFVNSLTKPASTRLPRLWTGRESLVEAISAEVDGANLRPIRRLSAGSPYASEDAGPLQRLVGELEPAKVEVLRPQDALGLPMSAPDWEHAVTSIAAEGMSPPTLHTLSDKLLTKGIERTTHLKWVYVEGTGGAILVVGSANLSDPAFGPHTRPGTNYETAVILQAPRGLRLLATDSVEPSNHERGPECELDPNTFLRPPIAPFHVTYDWSAAPGERAELIPLEQDARLPNEGARIRLVGEKGEGTPLLLRGPHLCKTACNVVRRALEVGPFVQLLERTPTDEAPVEHLVQVIELSQDHAPVRSHFGFSLDQFLRFVTAAGLGDWKRAERDADDQDRQTVEQDESLGDSAKGRPPLALDRPIAIIQATLQLETLARRAIKADDDGALARALFQVGGVSLRNMVDLHLATDDAESPGAEVELVDRLVCWLCLRSLLDDLAPRLPARHANHVAELDRALKGLAASWDEVEDNDRVALKQWLIANWRREDSAPSTAEEGAA